MSDRKQTKAIQAPAETPEPVPILECPPELGPAAREEWQRIVAELIAKGVLSRFDRGPLAAYCTAFALAMEAAEMVHKHGAMIKSPNGFPMQSPYLSHLTPASRSRIFSWDQKNSLVLDESVHGSDDAEW